MSEIIADRAARGERPWRVIPTPAFAAFLVYVFVILTQRLGVGTLAMAAALVGLLLQRDLLRTPRFIWLFAAWIAWAALGYAVTQYPEVVSDALIERGKVVLVTLVAVNVLRTDAQIRYFMGFMLVGYLLFPARSTLVNYVTGNVLGGRAIGPFMYKNPNDLAAVTILMLGPALALWASAARRTLVRWAALACAAPLVVIIVLTQSRGAFLAMIAIALPSAVALARRRPRAAIAFAGLVALVLYLAPAAFWKRMQGLQKGTSVATIGEMDPEGSAGQRFAVLKTAIRIVQDHPVLGIGMGAYGLANAQYNPALGDLDTHNTYLNVLAETGTPGLILFSALVISVLRTVRDARRRARRVSPAHVEMLRWLQFGLIGFLIAGVFGSLSKLTLLYVYLALLWSASRTVGAHDVPATASQPPPRQPDRMATPVDRFRGPGGSRPPL